MRQLAIPRSASPLLSQLFTPLRSPPLTLLLALLAALLGLQCLALLRAPVMWLPAQIAITLRAGESITLGRGELAAPQAAPSHMVLQRAGDGAWQVRALATAHAPALAGMLADDNLATVPALGTVRIQAGPQQFTVLSATQRQVDFTDGSTRWRYDGATLYRNDERQPPCPETRWPARTVAAWNALAAPVALSIARPMSIGGNLHCGNRLGVAGLSPESTTITSAKGQLRISGQPATARSLAGFQALAIGQTRYSMAIHGDTLLLQPARRVTLSSAPESRLPPQVAWTWTQRQLWTPLSLAAFGGAAILLAATLLAPPIGARFVTPLRLARALCLLGAGAGGLLLQRAGSPPPAAASLALAAFALSCWLPRGRLPRPAIACALPLLAIGLLLQLELGLSGGDSSWLRYYQKTAALLAIGTGLAALWQPFRPKLQPSQRQAEWLLLGAAMVALTALAAQVLWGDETGVFDLQPVEYAKLALCALSAHCLALGLGWREAAGARRYLVLLAPVLLFVALLASALLQVDDYSPLVLLAIWSGAMLLAFAIAQRRLLAAASTAALALAAACGVGALHHAGASAMQSLPAGFYADRFQVWLEPARHPHTGQQLLQGASAIAAGGVAGADNTLGLRALGLPAGDATAIPAVQDDFAPSFFLNRHGLLAAALLWCLQAAFLTALLHQAVASARAGAGARDYRHAWRERFRCFLLCGAGALIAGHLLLSWGTNLAILPVMGQPMSFLSAGGSHLLFFLLPLLAMCAEPFKE